MPSLVGIGLTDLPNMGDTGGPPGPPGSGITAFSTPEFKISTGPLEDGLCWKWKEFIDLGFECRLYFKMTI